MPWLNPISTPFSSSSRLPLRVSFLAHYRMPWSQSKEFFTSKCMYPISLLLIKTTLKGVILGIGYHSSSKGCPFCPVQTWPLPWPPHSSSPLDRSEWPQARLSLAAIPRPATNCWFTVSLKATALPYLYPYHQQKWVKGIWTILKMRHIYQRVQFSYRSTNLLYDKGL